MPLTEAAKYPNSGGPSASLLSYPSSSGSKAGTLLSIDKNVSQGSKMYDVFTFS